VNPAVPIKNLPILLGALRQEGLDGELVLEQNDGTRWLYLTRGELIHLKSDVAGEQFGNYLLRQGILDFKALSELLANDERYRLGEKVIQWGMMTLQERDLHLLTLQEQIMIHALEHPVHQWTWTPGPSALKLAQDLHFKLDHHQFVWKTFQESNYLMDLLTILGKEGEWRWSGRPDLLVNLSDLPLNPGTAYALSFLGAEPISFETWQSISHLEEEEAGRFLAILWALGALELTRGRLPSVAPKVPPPILEPLEWQVEAPSLPPPPPPPPPPPLPVPPPIHAAPPPRLPLPSLEWQVPIEPTLLTSQPEFIELEPEPEATEFRSPAFGSPAYSAPVPAPAKEPLDGPTAARKLMKKARNMMIQERTAEAIRALEQAVQLEPDEDPAYEAWLTLGQLRMANPAWSTRSIDALQNASRLRPKAAQPWAAMGEVYFRKGFQTNALACFRKALELDPSVPIPPGVELLVKTAPPEAKPTQGGLLGKFRSILGRSDKS